jgi:hypothetical protein
MLFQGVLMRALYNHEEPEIDALKANAKWHERRRTQTNINP